MRTVRRACATQAALLFRAWLNESLPGEQPGQLEALLERWQTSLDLHARYAALDDARYWHVQPWPKHERPQRWIIQLARKRILALQAPRRAAPGRRRSRLHRRHRDHGFPRHAGRVSPRSTASFRSPRTRPNAATCWPRSPSSRRQTGADTGRTRPAARRARSRGRADRRTRRAPRPRARCRCCRTRRRRSCRAAQRPAHRRRPSARRVAIPHAPPPSSRRKCRRPSRRPSTW